MRLRRPSIVLLAVGIWLTAAAAPASAHSAVKRSTPSPASTVGGRVDSVTLEFLEPVLPTPTITVSDPAGQVVPGMGVPHLDDQATIAEVDFEPLALEGTYRVDYSFVALDGDAQEDAYTFTYRADAAPTSTVTTLATPAEPDTTGRTVPEPATGSNVVDDNPDVTGAVASDEDGGLLPLGLDELRLFLHLLAATVWVGGQLTLAGLVPGLRAIDPDAPRAAARRFNRIAWPAFGVLIATGIWNLAEVDLSARSNAYTASLMLKLGLVGLSGAAALAHSVSRSKVVLAVGGALGLLGALGALLIGVQLTIG